MSQHSPMRSIRRGPTMRGGARGYRPPQRSSTHSSNDEDEEFLALNRSETREREQEQADLEMQQIDLNRQSLGERPRYHHGDETFGDVISHPFQQYQAHKQRRLTYQQKVEAWDEEEKMGIPHSMPSNAESEENYVLVVHFRQLRGNQSFVLDHQTAEEFAKKIKLTPQERIQFNGVHDTDGLTAFLYKTKREFSIKIHHHKSDLIRHSDMHHHSHDHLEHNPDNHIIEFNENVYIEFKPRSQIHHNHLPPEATRRPFFQHPEPDLSADIGQEKAASWLELFYDLFYVATLTEFTHSHVIKDWASLGTYASWFVITWWAWCASSLYTARFDTDDVVHHIWKLIEMCGVIAMAGTTEHFLHSPAYVLGYIALKAVLVVEYAIVLIVALMARSKSRIALSFYVGANLISIALWAASLAIIHQDTHRILWYLGILAEVLVNVISRGDKTLSWAASNLAERLGLLTLIVLGENLIGLINLVAMTGSEILIMLPNFMAVVIIFGFFFMYFEDFNKEVFLHNKHHQIWTYLHFPLHLCQVAFGIALIDTLKLYKQQMEKDGKISSSSGEAHASGSEGATTEASGSGESHAEASSGSSSESGSSSSAEPTASSSSAEPAAHKLAKRAIESVYPIDNDEYNPMALQRIHEERPPTIITTPFRSYASSGGYLTYCQYAISSVAMGAMHHLLGSSAEHQIYGNSSSSTSHHLVRRSASAEEDMSLTDAEKVFIYKTFLICGGLILVLNSLIKLLNTKIADIYGKVIIGSRILNAVVLWSMCALPFASLDAIVLLSVMMGSLILQGAVDLLD